MCACVYVCMYVRIYYMCMLECMCVCVYVCMYVWFVGHYRKITSCSHGNNVTSHSVIMPARPIDTTIMCLTTVQPSFETSLYNLIINLVW
jgi:hypothetical protein